MRSDQVKFKMKTLAGKLIALRASEFVCVRAFAGKSLSVRWQEKDFVCEREREVVTVRACAHTLSLSYKRT